MFCFDYDMSLDDTDHEGVSRTAGTDLVIISHIIRSCTFKFTTTSSCILSISFPSSHHAGSFTDIQASGRGLRSASDRKMMPDDNSPNPRRQTNGMGMTAIDRNVQASREDGATRRTKNRGALWAGAESPCIPLAVT